MSGWLTFANTCKQSFGLCDFQDQLIQECGGHPDMAWPVFYNLGSDSIPWLHRSIPSLDGARPIDLIQSGKADAVRDYLWAFPHCAL